MMSKKIKIKGFTLIELLVVIAIIGVLSSVVLSSLNSARAKARDTKRRTDITSLQKALELYYFDNFRYPAEGYWCDSSVGTRNGNCPPSPAGSDWAAGSDLRDLVPTYISQLPVDPINDSTYFYQFEPDGLTQGPPTYPACNVDSCRYVLWAKLEKGGTFTVKGGF